MGLPGSMASAGGVSKVDGSSIASDRWPWAARGSGAGHPFAAPGRHGAVRPQPGGLNQTGDHAAGAGVMTHTSARRAAPEPFTSPPLAPGSGPGRRADRRRPGSAACGRRRRGRCRCRAGRRCGGSRRPACCRPQAPHPGLLRPARRPGPLPGTKGGDVNGSGAARRALVCVMTPAPAAWSPV